MNRKRIHLQLFLFIFLFVGCQSQVPNEQPEVQLEHPCSETNIEDVNEIFIGATAPFSPPGAATEGLSMMVAFQIAERDVNLAGGVLGKPIRILIDDTAGLPARGREVAERFIKESCVVGIVGEYHSDVALEIMEVAHLYQVPTIFSDTYSDDITASLYPEIFRIAPNSSMVAQYEAQWLASVGDYNGDGHLFSLIIAEDTNFGQKQVEATVPWFLEYGVEMQSFMVDFSSRDFSETITKIQSLNTLPDSIILKVTGPASLDLLSQIIEANIGPNEQTLVVANQVALNHEIYWEEVPEGNGVIVPRIGPWTSTVTEQGLSFAQKYFNVLERWPDAHSFEAYDSVLLLANAINQAGSLDSKEIINALESTDTILASGAYTFPYGSSNPPGGYVPDYMWHQWMDPQLLLLQYTEPNQDAKDMDVIWPPEYVKFED